jgi:hypothetical protein
LQENAYDTSQALQIPHPDFSSHGEVAKAIFQHGLFRKTASPTK